MKTGHATSIQPRRFWLRPMVITAGVLIVLGIVGAIAIPRLIDVNTYRPAIQARASQRLGRQVTLGRAELTVFPQLSAVIHDVAVEGQGVEGKTALTASAVRARARLWPLLLSRRLEVTALSFEEPDIALVREASGKWNWEGMLERKGTESPARTEGGKSSFTLGDLGIHRGTVRVIDNAAELGQSVTFSIEPLDLDLHGYKAGRPFDVDVDGVMIAQEGRGALRFEGEVGPLPVPFDAAKLPLDGSVKADAFPLRAIQTYIRSEDGIRSLGGVVTSDLRLSI